MTGATAPLAGAGRAVRVVTLGPQAGRLEQASRRALLAAGVESALSLGTQDPRSFGERAQLLRDARPDLVLVPVADRPGIDRLALLAASLQFGCAYQRPRPRVILATADDGAIARASTLLRPFEMEIAGDVRQDEGRRAVVARLRELRREGGILWDEALEELARSLARVTRAASLVVDVTSGSTSLVRADADGATIAAHVRPLGMGSAADRVIARGGIDRLRRWIPWAVDAPTLLERVFARSRWPAAVPADRETLALEIALAHETVAIAVAEADRAGIGGTLRSAATVLVTGRPAALPVPSRTVLIVADSLDLLEPASVARDEGDDLVRLAAEALGSGDRSTLDAALAERALPLAGLVPVATARTTTIRLRGDDGTAEERVSRDAFFVMPDGRHLEVSGSGVVAGRVASGGIGLVIDARPHPIALPLRDAERLPTVARWYETLGATPADVAEAPADERSTVRA